MDSINIFVEYGHYFLEGTRTTIIIAFVTVLCGSLLGFGISLMRMSKNKLINGFASVYITVFRGTPLLVQLWIVYIQLDFLPIPQIVVWSMHLDRIVPCIIALTLNSAAYIAEIIRSGIQSVDIGQTEAARSMGMSKKQAMRLIILPQAIKNILPAICNEFVTMIKETAVLQYLGVSDIMYNNNIVMTMTYSPLPCYYISAVIYLIINLVLGKGVNMFEMRMKRSDR